VSGRRVIVTGAGSYLGQAVIQAMAARGDLQVTALGSPRWDARAPEGVTAWACDLTAALAPTLTEAIDDAEAIVHLAWARGADPSAVAAQNDAMLAHLARGAGLARVTFASTVAAGSRSPSVYGRAKQAAADRVDQAGGRVLVLGGVVTEPPGSSYAALCEAVGGSRLALRFLPPIPQLHLTDLPAVIDACIAGATEACAPGVHAVFDANPVSINAFMKQLEDRAPRVRCPAPLWVPAIVALAGPLSPTGVGPLLDRLTSFVGRDVAWLDTLRGGA